MLKEQVETPNDLVEGRRKLLLKLAMRLWPVKSRHALLLNEIGSFSAAILPTRQAPLGRLIGQESRRFHDRQARSTAKPVSN